MGTRAHVQCLPVSIREHTERSKRSCWLILRKCCYVLYALCVVVGGGGWQLLHRVQNNAAEVVQDMNTTLFFDPKTRVR